MDRLYFPTELIESPSYFGNEEYRLAKARRKEILKKIRTTMTEYVNSVNMPQDQKMIGVRKREGMLLKECDELKTEYVLDLISCIDRAVIDAKKIHDEANTIAMTDPNKCTQLIAQLKAYHNYINHINWVINSGRLHLADRLDPIIYRKQSPEQAPLNNGISLGNQKYNNPELSLYASEDEDNGVFTEDEDDPYI
jgi:hypothetical protein